ncbi:hypothetical protein BIU98_00415 [Curtobacterium sp. MMLR14_010]|uniref:hypothetical protein n=1 Tax=Curtobacterium sp. MMLR14_010 TaxID=1898743 RepID=UPI0008DD0CAD|nr:hypothetical protein [Curtobacterium sp. MMLR14_010]OII36051.1 hypothetical protein BIU98_00415 [Curtobacterium sp. MMLR14_010]
MSKNNTKSTVNGRSAAPQTKRTAARTIHLIAGGLLGLFIYAPPTFAEPLRLFLQVVVIPAAVITGMFIWKQAAIRRLLTRRHRRSI